MNGEQVNCPVCEGQAKSHAGSDYNQEIFCKDRCRATFYLPEDENISLESLSDWEKTALSRYLRTRKQKTSIEVTQKIVDDLTIISPQKQADNLIIYIGDNQRDLYYPLMVDRNNKSDFFSEIGISVKQEDKNLEFIAQFLLKKGFLSTYNPSQLSFVFALSMEGWNHYEQLKRCISESRKGFFALKFNAPELDTIYLALKSRFKDDGYDFLNPLLDLPKSGCIDARLEREIRESRFLVADLTHGNQGVYWEAGLAHGLGKPVFYTCKKNQEAEEQIKRHFDISHHTTIFWQPGKEQEFAKEVAAAVFNTIAA
ncbi:MAG: hypothetical protein ABW189_05130 [Rickettsiales bacterium]